MTAPAHPTIEASIGCARRPAEAVAAEAEPLRQRRQAVRPRVERSCRIRPSLALLTATILLALVFALSISTGPVKVPAGEAVAVIAHRWLNLPIAEPGDPRTVAVVYSIRFPKLLLAVLVGAGLALAGVAAQALVRNPMAEPFVLGISGGATVGTVAVISYGIGTAGLYWQSGGAVLGAAFALFLVMMFARGVGGVVSPVRLVLAGIAIGHLLAAAASYLILRHQGRESIYAWLSGDLGNARLHELWLPAGVLLTAVVLLLLDAGRMNALLIGDETAASLGVNVTWLRWRLILVVSVLVGVMVAQTGIIGFVGLVVPHMARLLVGTDHRHVIPLAAVGGAAYLVTCDLIAREAMAPQLLPIGIVAGGLGAPLFLLLIRRGIATKGA